MKKIYLQCALQWISDNLLHDEPIYCGPNDLILELKKRGMEKRFKGMTRFEQDFILCGELGLPAPKSTDLVWKKEKSIIDKIKEKDLG